MLLLIPAPRWSVLLEYFFGYGDRGHGAGPAGIERQVGDRLDQLLLRQAVIRCSYSSWGPLYCSSLTFSIQLTTLPSSSSWMAICVMVVVGDAPCQCLSPGEQQTTSPGRMTLIGPPQACTKPQPDVTMSV